MCVCVCVCVHSESDIWHISQDELPATPKIKPTTTTKATETANALLKLPSLSCPCRHTHMQTHTEWISLRYAQEFPQHLVLWYLALGTLAAACCSRFSSPWMLDSCASCLLASQKSEKKNQLAFSEIASAIRFFFARVESFLKRRKFYPRIFFSILFFKNSFIECSWSEF